MNPNPSCARHPRATAQVRHDIVTSIKRVDAERPCATAAACALIEYFTATPDDCCVFARRQAVLN